MSEATRWPDPAASALDGKERRSDAAMIREKLVIAFTFDRIGKRTLRYYRVSYPPSGVLTDVPHAFTHPS